MVSYKRNNYYEEHCPIKEIDDQKWHNCTSIAKLKRPLKINNEK